MQGHAILEDEDDCINFSYPLCVFVFVGFLCLEPTQTDHSKAILKLLDAAFKVSCHCQFLRFSTFPWMYLLSGIFKDAEMAFITYVCINLFISVNTILSTSILHFLGQISLQNPEVSINCLCPNAAEVQQLKAHLNAWLFINSWMKLSQSL